MSASPPLHDYRSKRKLGAGDASADHDYRSKRKLGAGDASADQPDYAAVLRRALSGKAPVQEELELWHHLWGQVELLAPRPPREYPGRAPDPKNLEQECSRLAGLLGLSMHSDCREVGRCEARPFVNMPIIAAHVSFTWATGARKGKLALCEEDTFKPYVDDVTGRACSWRHKAAMRHLQERAITRFRTEPQWPPQVRPSSVRH